MMEREQFVFQQAQRQYVRDRCFSWLLTCLIVGGGIYSFVVWPWGKWSILLFFPNSFFIYGALTQDVRHYLRFRRSYLSVDSPRSFAPLARRFLPTRAYEQMFEPSLADLTVDFTAEMAECRDDHDRQQALTRRFNAERRRLLFQCWFEYAKDRVGAAIRFLPNPFRS